MVPRILGEQNEFAAYRPLSAAVVASVMEQGYMPMGMPGGPSEVFLVKCHRRRSVVDPTHLEVSKSTVRASRGLILRCNQRVSETIAAVAECHHDSWITPALSEVFAHLSAPRLGRPRVHGITLNDGATGELVAAEIGYQVGRVYTSLSGCFWRSGAGTVQMVALAGVLARAGYALWDLGMDMPYKRSLGAREVPRAEFLARYRRDGREADTMPALPGSDHAQSAEELVRTMRGNAVERRRASRG